MTVISQIRPTSEGLLSDLGGIRQADLFCAWRGASARRYVVSVYPVDRDVLEAGLPHFDAFVLVSVRWEGRVRRPLAIVAIERASDRRLAVAEALSLGAEEWHLHLLAESRLARADVLRDLRLRHGAGAELSRSA